MTAWRPPTLVLIALVLLPRLSAAQARDAGPPPGAGKARVADARAAAARPGDLGTLADGWLAGQIRTLEADLVRALSDIEGVERVMLSDDEEATGNED